MDARLAALKLVLDEIGEDSNIGSVEDRLRLQKAIYIVQAAGLNLGYHYSWYLKGPDAPSLAQDYYELAGLLSAGAPVDKTLTPGARQAVGPVRAILQKPAEIALSKAQWYELLASLHYLSKTGRRSVEDANQFLAGVKPHLIPYIAHGREHLARHGLV